MVQPSSFAGFSIFVSQLHLWFVACHFQKPDPSWVWLCFRGYHHVPGFVKVKAAAAHV